MYYPYEVVKLSGEWYTVKVNTAKVRYVFTSKLVELNGLNYNHLHECLVSCRFYL